MQRGLFVLALLLHCVCPCFDAHAQGHDNTSLKAGADVQVILSTFINNGELAQVERKRSNNSSGPQPKPSENPVNTAPQMPEPASSRSEETIGRVTTLLRILIWVCGVLFLFCLLAAVLAWVFRYRLKFYRAGSTVFYDRDQEVSFYLKEISVTLKNLMKEQAAAGEQQKELLSQIVKNNDILLKGVTVISIQEDSPDSPADIRLEPTLVLDPGVFGDAPAPASAHFQQAQNSYLNLINRIPTTPEPIYLEVEGARSIAGRLEDSTVYLSQMPHSQAAFVLFTENGDSGWVFPNPTISFRSAEFRDVFPRLTEGEFAAAKEKIVPRLVRKIEKGRWILEPGQNRI